MLTKDELVREMIKDLYSANNLPSVEILGVYDRLAAFLIGCGWVKEEKMDKLKVFHIIAYAECDEGYLPRKETTVMAIDHKDAMRQAWRLFPEYHEVGAFEKEER